MKSGLLTSFVAIALIAAAVFSNAIPATVGALPPFKRQVAAAPLSEASGLLGTVVPGSFTGISSILPSQSLGSSKDLAKLASRLDVEIPEIEPTSLASISEALKRGGNDYNEYYANNNNINENNGENNLRDVRFLNLALLLADFLAAFFERGLSRYRQEDFISAGYPEWVRGRYEKIYEHKRRHREFLQSAITGAGGEYVRPCRYEFKDNDVHAFVDYSEAVQSISASSYTGSLHYFNNRAYITTGASILAVEARHAAWINSAVRKQNPWNTAFETPLTPNEVATLLSTFFEFESCPAGNSNLLPEGLRPYPQLSLSPKLIPGEKAEISFPDRDRNNNNGERLYAAFLSGIETIFVPVEERSGNEEGSNRNDAANNRNNNNNYNGNNKQDGNNKHDGNNKQGGNNKHDGNNNQDGNNKHDGNNNYAGNNNGNNNHNENENNRKRYFVEIPRDLEACGTVFVLIVRGSDNIRDVSLDNDRIVAGPAIAMFPSDANGKPIVW